MLVGITIVALELSTQASVKSLRENIEKIREHRPTSTSTAEGTTTVEEIAEEKTYSVEPTIAHSYTQVSADSQPTTENTYVNETLGFSIELPADMVFAQEGPVNVESYVGNYVLFKRQTKDFSVAIRIFAEVPTDAADVAAFVDEKNNYNLASSVETIRQELQTEGSIVVHETSRKAYDIRGKAWPAYSLDFNNETGYGGEVFVTHVIKEEHPYPNITNYVTTRFIVQVIVIASIPAEYVDLFTPSIGSFQPL